MRGEARWQLMAALHSRGDDPAGRDTGRYPCVSRQRGTCAPGISN